MHIDAVREAAQPLAAILPNVAWLPHALVRRPDGRLDKPPCEGATSNNPASWFTLDKALELLATAPRVAGIAFAITPGIIALDYDNCRDPTSGEITAQMAQELETFNSYAYVTPSGKGIRIVGTNKSNIPGGKKVRYLPDGSKVEIFIGPTNHYNTFTQDLLAGYTELRDISDSTLDYLEGLQGAQFDKLSPATAPASNPDATRGITAIRAALRNIPNSICDWDYWSLIGMAVWRSSGGSEEGEEAWIEWSARNPEHNNKDTCEERWKHWCTTSPPTRVGFGTLHHMARQANPLFTAPPDTHDVLPAPREPEHDPETGEILNLIATPFDPATLTSLAPRQWVYGHFIIRRFLSVLGAPGGAGKTAYAMTIGVAVALNKPLLSEVVHESGAVWIYNLEDPMDEVLRRLQAICLLNHINPADLVGKLYLDSGREKPLVIARVENGVVTVVPVVEDLIAELRRRAVKLLIVDPVVKSHKLEENKNEQIDFAATLWNYIADKADCAILLLHHFRKGGVSGEADAFRGASALVDAARAAVSLSTMTEKEADKLGIPEEERRFYARVDNAKLNLAPPPAHALWLRLNSVELPNGDKVQAVSRWEAPSLWAGIPMRALVNILDIIGAGKGGEQYTLDSRGANNARWAGQVVVDELGYSEGQAKEMLAAWVRSGLLKETKYHSQSQRRERSGCEVDSIKISEMRQSIRDT